MRSGLGGKRGVGRGGTEGKKRVGVLRGEGGGGARVNFQRRVEQRVRFR